MKFTIVFPSHESRDFSIGALFTPCLEWKVAEMKPIIPHSDDPHYQRGDLQLLLKLDDLRSKISDHTNRVTIVAHSNGHGTGQYLSDLMADLEEEGFLPSVIHQ